MKIWDQNGTKPAQKSLRWVLNGLGASGSCMEKKGVAPGVGLGAGCKLDGK